MKIMYVPLMVCLFLTSGLLGQTTNERIVDAFATTTNDSVFISTYSKVSYEKHIAQRYTLPHVFDEADSLIFYHTNAGDILGPFEMDSFIVYVKVLSVDSAIRMRVGNIYLNPKKRGESNTEKLSKELLTQLQKNNNFDAVCQKYADDNNKNKECDLGWFFQGVMVSEFEEEVLNHKKDAIFIVNTQFGKHIVKMIDNPVLDRYKVEYTFLYLDNN